VTALSVIPRHDVPRNPSTSFGVPYRRDPLKRDVAPTMNDPVNVIMTQSVKHRWSPCPLKDLPTTLQGTTESLFPPRRIFHGEAST